VLEIGTGSGLLAMMAARAGAGTVVTCEANPAVAAAARDVIAANGLADRIRVIGAHSTTLDAADIGGAADILVSEIVSNDMVSQGVLPAHEHAVAHLLKPGAAVIPARGRVRVALAEHRGRGVAGLHESCGFDLSAFNRLAQPWRHVAIESPQLSLRSDPADLFDFDFASGGPWPASRAGLALASTGGTVNGIAQWIALDMDDAEVHENLPASGARSCWACVFWPFAESVATSPGETVAIASRHEKDRVRLWRK
jgi:hypothetical protein